MVIHETNAPLVLHPEQAAVLRAMSARDDAGNFRYSTWVYSAPKKSGKTTVCAGIALWQAWRIPHGDIYLIGNDLNQADNRMAEAIRFAVEHDPAHAGRYKIRRLDVELDNGTVIHAIPVDPHGEAGMNPTGIFYTEAWGAKTEKHKLLWTEAALSPTRAGQAFTLVESYAGHVGEAPILEPLYKSIIQNGIPDPQAPELFTRGGMIGYWCTRHIQEWQLNETGRRYYADEEDKLTPSEFRRLHYNEWGTSENAFVPADWWDRCQGIVQPAGNNIMVLSVDAGVSSDCFAIIGVTRANDVVHINIVRIWKPEGKPLDFAEPEAELKRLIATHQVYCVVYDAYQLHDMMTRIRKETGVFVDDFNQGARRLEADKQLYDMIREQRIRHDGNPTLKEHVANANAKTDSEDGKLRIVKRAAMLKIDGAVATSMGTSRIMELLI